MSIGFFTLFPMAANASNQCYELFKIETLTKTSEGKAPNIVKKFFLNASTKHGAELTSDDPNAFADKMLAEVTYTPDHTDSETFGQKGFSANKEQQLQAYSAANGFGRVGAYFRFFESEMNKTYNTISALWSREKKSKGTDKWKEAIEKSYEHIDLYKSLDNDLKSLVAEGFEAYQLSLVLREILRTYSRGNFAKMAKNGDGIHYLRPKYLLNIKTGQIEKRNVPVMVYRYDTLLLDYKAALEQFESIFGVIESPAQRVSMQARLTNYSVDWSQLKSPVFYINIPLTIVGRIYSFGTGTIGLLNHTGRWTWSIVKNQDGKFQRRAVKQAFEKRRLESIREALLSRSKLMNVPLNKDEATLVYHINNALAEKELLPNSRATAKQQTLELQAEKNAFINKSIKEDNPDRLEPLSIYKTVSEDVSSVSLFGLWRKKAVKQIKTYGPSVILTGFLVTQAVKNIETIKEALLDNPVVAHTMTAASNISYNFQKEYFGLETIVRSDVKEGNRDWAFENVSVPAVAEKGTSIYQQEFRLDDNNEFLSDPAYQNEIREIIETSMIEREKRGGAVALQYAQSEAKRWGYPTRTTKIIIRELTKQYPQHIESLNQILSLVLHEVDKGIDLRENHSFISSFILKNSQDLPLKLVAELELAFGENLTPLIEYYDANGDLRNPYGTIYTHFLEVDKSLALLKPNTDIRSTSDKLPSNIIKTVNSSQLVIIKGEADSFGLIEIEFINKQLSSPSGHFFVLKSQLKFE